MSQKPLPKLVDLHKSPEEAFKNDEFLSLVNQPPHTSWIKKNKYANNSEYLPIDKVEFWMDYIFQRWKVEVLKTEVLLNAVAVTIRLHYIHPPTGEWTFHDGVGAKEIELQQGALPYDLTKITAKAIAKCLPTAKSEAIKDAADHIGRLFGRDLNRKDTVGFEPGYDKPDGVIAPAPTSYPVSSVAVPNPQDYPQMPVYQPLPTVQPEYQQWTNPPQGSFDDYKYPTHAQQPNTSFENIQL